MKQLWLPALLLAALIGCQQSASTGVDDAPPDNQSASSAETPDDANTETVVLKVPGMT